MSRAIWIVWGGLAGLAGCAGTERPQDARASAPSSSPSSAGAPELRFDFESGDVGAPPTGFTSARTGDGPPGAWVIARADPAHGQVLAQVDPDDTDSRYPLCVVDGVSARDVRASVRFATQSGTVDQAAGLVVRYENPGAYYVARANALEGNVRFYRVQDGVRKQLASARLAVASGAWHELVLEARGSHFRVDLDGAALLEVDDATSDRAGGVGLWTKADSVTWFDDLAIRTLDAGR